MHRGTGTMCLFTIAPSIGSLVLGDEIIKLCIPIEDAVYWIFIYMLYHNLFF